MNTNFTNFDRTTFVAGVFALYFLLCVWRYFQDPLRSVPGPFLTRFTRLWELHAIRSSGFQETHLQLHAKYGPIFRLAPNKYSLDNSREIDQIYRHGSRFVKAPFYHAFGNPDVNLADTFSERSITRHAMKRRKVASLYSTSTLLSYEQFVDRCNRTLSDRLCDFAKSGVSIDIPTWMQLYAFDVIGEISVGQPFGFMDKGYDFNGILAAIHESMTYGSRVGLFAELHPVLAWIATTTKQPIPFDKVLHFVNSNIKARENGDLPTDRKDFLTALMNLRKQGKIEDHDIVTSLGANIAAGSDTTAISLSTIIYYLTRNPLKAQRLRDEIRKFEERGEISQPATFQEVQKMPYLQAVIKEALRIHPATGQLLGRVVPPGGATICGRFLPAGTEVGTSPWLTHFDETIFGRDAHDFVPERWLESDQRTSRMNAHLLSFGAGARVCLGKNISMLEMTKVIPELYRRYDFVLDPAEKKWELDMVWFVKQRFSCRVIIL